MYVIIGDNVLKSLKDAPEKFLGSTISYSGKSLDIFELAKAKLDGMAKTSCMVRDEFKLRVYT